VSLRALLPWLLVGAACIHYDRDGGAPGLVDVARPPYAPGLRLLEPARPPGERLFALSPGALLLGGVRGIGHDARGAGSLGGELSVEWGTIDENHHHTGDEDHQRHLELPSRGWQQGLVLPERAWGLTAGAQLFDDGVSGPLSLELRRRDELALYGLGPFYQPSSRHAGVVASAQWAIFVLRAGYSADGAFAHAGLDLFYPITWVRTR
jgi:hypothetical protein